jgi:endonuclease G, mitochondrial
MSGKYLGKALARAFLQNNRMKLKPPRSSIEQVEFANQQSSTSSSILQRYAIYGAAASILFAGGYICATFYSIPNIKKKISSSSIASQSPSISTPIEHESLILGGSAPSTLYRRVSDNFVAEYDTSTRNPRWVVERLTSSSLLNTSSDEGKNRSKFQFHEDTSIPLHLRARLSDYEHSGYDRGHLSAAADNKSSDIAMKDSFLLTNICPQIGEGFNRDYWARFEHFIRKLTGTFKTVYVCTGPLFLPTSSSSSSTSTTTPSIILSDEKNLLGSSQSSTSSILPTYRYSHPAIGQQFHWVQVPTHFFKVIVCTSKTTDEPLVTAAFVIPNTKINSNEALINFLVPIETVEAISGLQFFKEMLQQIQVHNNNLLTTNNNNEKKENMTSKENEMTLIDEYHLCRHVDCTLPLGFDKRKKIV